LPAVDPTATALKSPLPAADTSPCRGHPGHGDIPIPDSGNRTSRDLPRSQLFGHEPFDALHVVPPNIAARDFRALQDPDPECPLCTGVIAEPCTEIHTVDSGSARDYQELFASLAA